jgi:predicted RNA-binding Zn-ribbon protein involved in translation (DUF1610 family)
MELSNNCGIYPVFTEFPIDFEGYSQLESNIELYIEPFELNQNNTKSYESSYDCFNDHQIENNHSNNIVKCSSCNAYINKYCLYTSFKWNCSLCGERNIFSRNTVS